MQLRLRSANGRARIKKKKVNEGVANVADISCVRRQPSEIRVGAVVVGGADRCWCRLLWLGLLHTIRNFEGCSDKNQPQPHAVCLEAHTAIRRRFAAFLATQQLSIPRSCAVENRSNWLGTNLNFMGGELLRHAEVTSTGCDSFGAAPCLSWCIKMSQQVDETPL